MDCNKGLDGITLVKGLRSYVAKDAILFKLPSYIIAEKRFYLKLNNIYLYVLKLLMNRNKLNLANFNLLADKVDDE